MKKVGKVIKTIFNIFITVFVLLFLLMVCLQRFSNNQITFLGYRMFSVASSSMAPDYQVGDVLIVKITEPEDIKVGDKLKIHCYKHDGTLEHTSDEAIVLENNDDLLICGNGRTKITEKDGRSHMTNEPAVLFFYKKHWFNIIGQLKQYGLFYSK